MTTQKWLIVGDESKRWKEHIEQTMLLDGLNFDCVGTFEDEEAFTKTDINDLVDFDAALVLSSQQYHYQHCIHLLRNSKNVLCKKPLCFSQDELKELFVASQQKQKMIAQICLNRFNSKIAEYGKILLQQKKFELTHKVYEAEDRLPINLTYEVALDDIDTFLFFFFSIPVKLNFGTVDKLEDQVHELSFGENKIDLLGTKGEMKQQIIFFEEGIDSGFSFIDGPEFLRIELEIMKMIEELEFRERAKKPLDPFYLEVELDFSQKEIDEKKDN